MYFNVHGYNNWYFFHIFFLVLSKFLGRKLLRVTYIFKGAPCIVICQLVVASKICDTSDRLLAILQFFLFVPDQIQFFIPSYCRSNLLTQGFTICFERNRMIKFWHLISLPLFCYIEGLGFEPHNSWNLSQPFRISYKYVLQSDVLHIYNRVSLEFTLNCSC